jgi:PAS domain S-box-containing protein
LFHFQRKGKNRLYMKKRIELLEKLNTYTTQLSHVSDYGTLSRLISKIIKDILEYEYFTLFFLDEEEAVLKLFLADGFDSREKKEAEETAMDRIPGQVLNSGEIFYLPDASACPDFKKVKLNKSDKIGSVIHIPVKSDKRNIGTFCVASSEKNYFHPEIIQILSLLSNTIGLAYSHLSILYFNTEILEREKLLNKQVVSQLKELQDINNKLRDNEKKFRNLTEALPEMICEIDIQGKLTYVNQYALNKFGYRKEDIKDFSVFRIFSPEDIPKAQKRFAGWMQGKELLPEEYTALKKDGSTFPVLVYVNPIIEQNRFAGIRGVMVDISERKKSEEKLRKAYDSNKSIIENMPYGIVIVGKDRKIRNINKAALALIGKTQSEIVGKPCYDNICPAEKDQCPIWDLKQKIDRSEKTLINHSGKKIPVLKTAIPITLNNEDVLLESFVDISDLKEAQEKIRQSQQNMSTFFNTMNDFLFVISPAGKIINYNQTVNQRLGYGINDLSGKMITELFHAKNETEFGKKMHSLTEGKIVQCQNFIVDSGGKELPVETVMNQGRWDDKDAIYVISKDISKLKTSEEKFAKAFQGSPIMKTITTFDEGKYLEVNTSFLENFGYANEEVIGRTTEDLDIYLNPGKREKLRNKILKQGAINNEEIILRKKNGELSFCLISADVIDIQGEKCLLSVISDITKRKHIEEELRKNQEQLQKNLHQQELLSEISMTFNSPESFDDKINYVLRIIGEHSHVSRVYIFENNNQNTHTNNTFEWCNTGIEPQIDELQNIPYEIIPSWNKILMEKGMIFSENIEELPEDLRVILEPQGILSIVILPIHISEKYFGFIGFDECKKKRVWTKSEIELLKTISNIISNAFERRMMEISLIKSEKTNSAILDGLPDTIFHFNKEGSFLNYKIGKGKDAELFKSDFIGKNVHEIFPPEFAENVLSAIHETLQHGTFGFEYKLPLEGIMHDYEARLVKINENEVVSLVRNVSERRRYEKELKEARDKAEQASMAKSEFLANMSHEIRTPMNAILGFSEILLEKTSDPISQKHVKAILGSGQTLLALINDLLDLSKIEAGKLEIEPEPVDLKTVFEEIRQMFIQKTEEKNLVFNIKIGAHIPDTLMLDEVRIRQILFNLVGNAIKFTNSGYIKLSVESKQHRKKQEYDLVFEVEDTGIGIPEDQQEIIFEAFRQQSGQSIRKYGGTGLGLAITKKLVEKMGGTVTLKSMIGKGSVFSILLKGIPGSKGRKVHDRDNNLDYNSLEFAPATIMIVDDIEYNIEILKKMIQRDNFRFIEANSGEKALLLLKLEMPDLIFMDLRMQGISGYECTEEIRKIKKFKKTPIIAFTASAMKDDVDKVKENFSDYVRKPVSKSNAFEILKKYIPYKEQAKTKATQAKGAATEIIDKKTLEKIPLVLDIMENKLFQHWEKVRNDLVIFEIEEFLKHMKAEVESFELQCVNEYIKRLQESIESFDVEYMEKQIRDFPALINEIKVFKKNK